MHVPEKADMHVCLQQAQPYCIQEKINARYYDTRNECEEERVVSLTNTCPDPGTVMVELCNAASAVPAVATPGRTYHLAYATESCARVHSELLCEGESYELWLAMRDNARLDQRSQQ